MDECQTHQMWVSTINFVISLKLITLAHIQLSSKFLILCISDSPQKVLLQLYDSFIIPLPTQSSIVHRYGFLILQATFVWARAFYLISLALAFSIINPEDNICFIGLLGRLEIYVNCWGQFLTHSRHSTVVITIKMFPPLFGPKVLISPVGFNVIVWRRIIFYKMYKSKVEASSSAFHLLWSLQDLFVRSWITSPV